MQHGECSWTRNRPPGFFGDFAVDRIEGGLAWFSPSTRKNVFAIGVSHDQNSRPVDHKSSSRQHEGIRWRVSGEIRSKAEAVLTATPDELLTEGGGSRFKEGRQSRIHHCALSN